jgi:hypothetical protein
MIIEEELPQPQKDALPEVSSDKHFQVNINLKPLFTPGAQGKLMQFFYILSILPSFWCSQSHACDKNNCRNAI